MMSKHAVKLVSILVLLVIGGCATLLNDKGANGAPAVESCYKPVAQYGYYR